MKKRKKHVRYNGGVIRPRGDSFQAEYSRHGKALRRQFPNIKLCQAWIDSQAFEHEQATAPPSMAEIIEAREARAILPEGASIITAARAYAALHDSPDPDRTLRKAVETFLSDKAAANMRGRSYGQLSLHVRRLAGMHDGPLVAITTDDVQEWLDSTGTRGWTRDGYRRAWHNLFEWCFKRGYIHRNPVAAISAFNADSNGSAKNVLAPAQAGAILKTAYAHAAFNRLLPFVALKLYTGIRTAEAMAITWGSITPGYVRVIPAVAKMRRQRLIPVRPALKSILAVCDHQTGRIAPISSRHMLGAMRDLYQAAHVERRHNDMRDSWITYRMAETQDLAKTAAEAGNSATVALESYRDLATPQAARAYFNAWKPPKTSRKM